MTTPRRDKTPQVLHNMSVPPTSRITVARVRLPGVRFSVDLASSLGKKGDELRNRLATGGWRTAWTVLECAKDAPPARAGRRRREDLERHLGESLTKAGVPDRPGVFLEEEVVPGIPALAPAAALAVLARRSGALYLPSRRLEPSLADPRHALVLFFPEEEIP